MPCLPQTIRWFVCRLPAYTTQCVIFALVTRLHLLMMCYIFLYFTRWSITSAHVPLGCCCCCCTLQSGWNPNHPAHQYAHATTAARAAAAHCRSSNRWRPHAIRLACTCPTLQKSNQAGARNLEDTPPSVHSGLGMPLLMLQANYNQRAATKTSSADAGASSTAGRLQLLSSRVHCWHYCCWCCWRQDLEWQGPVASQPNCLRI